MDSLTQITLGAAVGEVILGRKIGNRALLWGAVGGTIPDLDVLGNFFMSEVDSLAFHRGISHSIFFSVVGALVFGWFTEKFYKSKYYKYLAFAGWAAFIFGILLLLNIILKKQSIHLIAFIVSIGLYVFIVGRLVKSYIYSDAEMPSATVKDWQKLFFWTIFTHPLLDAFTTYGTQLFQPFSDYRVAFNTISVADPIYTVPFLLCVIVCSFFSRNSLKRKWINYSGLIISSLYLLFTVFNKMKIDSTFAQSLGNQGISYERFMTTPTILNNILWQGIAQDGDSFYMGSYSLFDSQDITFIKVDKNESILQIRKDDRTIGILKWFTNGYYNVITRNDGKLQINDLRYGSLNGNYQDEDSYVFRFPLELNDEGNYVVSDSDGGPPEGSEEEMFKVLIDRIKGN
ncbi:MAG: metal-dependent hydrolase [Saprospiraceae bacterium]|nr:metal-dependent hydrolase [Saprospiraceae bacterium]